MTIRVLNLDRSPERMAAFVATNPHLESALRFSAVDGKHVPLSEMLAAGLIKHGVDYTPGAIGCALSHLSLWDDARVNDRTVTVVEDDAVVHRDFIRLSEQVISQLPDDWDIVLWGWNFDAIFIHDSVPGCGTAQTFFNQDELRDNIGRYPFSRFQPTATPLQRAFGTIGYSISAAGATRLLQHCIPIRPMDLPVMGAASHCPNFGIDVMMNVAYPHLNSYACYPPLIVTENRREHSTVQPHNV